MKIQASQYKVWELEHKLETAKDIVQCINGPHEEYIVSIVEVIEQIVGDLYEIVEEDKND